LDADCPADLGLTVQEERQAQALAHFAAGLLLEFENDGPNDIAGMHLRRAMQLAPTSALAVESAVYSEFLARDYTKVVEILRPVLAEHPDEPHLVLTMAEALDAGGQTDAAVACLRGGFEAGNRSSGRILRRLSSILWRERRQDELKKLLRQAEHSPSLRDSFDFHYALALHSNAVGIQERRGGASTRALRRLHRTSRAHLAQAVELADDDIGLEETEALANLLIASGDWEQARVFLERFADLHDSPELWLMKAEAMVHCGALPQAVAYLDELVALYLPVDRFADAANILLAAGHPSAAARIFRRFLRSEPDSEEARVQLAWIYSAAERPAAGLDALRPLRDLSSTGGLFVAARLHCQLGQYDEALKNAKEAKRLALNAVASERTVTHILLLTAEVYDLQKNTRAAIRTARSAQAAEPDSPQCANMLGYLLADANQDLSEAEKLIRKAVEAEPDNAAYQDSLAWVLYRQQRVPEALAAIDRALRLDLRQDWVILDHAGDIAMAAGLRRLAEAYWAQSLAVDSSASDTVRRKLEASRGVDGFHNDR
jgi:tetratricopeptide (TPR) repeat protein